jgi:hypothetical protein
MRAVAMVIAVVLTGGAAATQAAEKKITFTGCVRQGKQCFLLASADGKLAYALVRDLKGKIQAGQSYRVVGTLSNSTPCDGVAGSLDPKKAEPVTLECRDDAVARH